MFDTEFFLRLVYAGHYPELTDEELSASGASRGQVGEPRGLPSGDRGSCGHLPAGADALGATCGRCSAGVCCGSHRRCAPSASGCSQVAARHGLELRARPVESARASNRRPHGGERASMESSSRWRSYHSRVLSRSSAPPATALTRASASSSGSADPATNPFTPSSISSLAAFSGPETTTDGVPTEAASTITRPPPSRSEGCRRQEARRDRSHHLLCLHPSAQGDGPTQPELADHGPGCFRLRPVSEDLTGGAPKPPRAMAIAGGIAGIRFSGMCLPAATTKGGPLRSIEGGTGLDSLSSIYAPVSRTTGVPGRRQKTALHEPREGEALIGQPDAEALDRGADPAADRTQVALPVLERPAPTNRRSAGLWTASARGKRGAEQRRSGEGGAVYGVVAPPMAQQMPEHAHPETIGGQIPSGPRR